MTTWRVMIVDAHTMVRQGLRALLSGYPDLVVVGEAVDGASALARARQLQPDVILLDIQLPDGEGTETVAALHQQVPASRIIILTAATDDPDLVYRAIRAGALGFISKDGDVEELVKAIRAVGEGQAVLVPQSLTSLVAFITRAPAPAEEAPCLTERLSAREQEVLELVAQGCTNREIAERLVVSESTVRSHLHNILDKLQLSNRVQAATFALRQMQGERDGRGKPRRLPAPLPLRRMPDAEPMRPPATATRFAM
ncbi:MAG TPA: response regulator transcription factor [Isosphaeraceae bacterium]|nr:response regulator transcription factor [Isosphaeraceae bacterium]